MVCPKCQSTSLSIIPSEIRLYRNCLRTLSYPPLSPSPDINVCLECGWSEFSIPRAWLSAGWLRARLKETATGIQPAARSESPALSSNAR